MSKQFLDYNLEQLLFLPPSLDDWLPEGHLARFVGKVVEVLDLSAIYATYEEGDGQRLGGVEVDLWHPQSAQALPVRMWSPQMA